MQIGMTHDRFCGRGRGTHTYPERGRKGWRVHSRPCDVVSDPPVSTRLPITGVRRFVW